MSTYMINATAGHAEIDYPLAQTKDKYNGVFTIRNSKTRVSVSYNDEFTSIIDNSESDYYCEKIELLNKGYIKSVKTEEAKELTDGEKKDNEKRIKKKLKPLKYYIHKVHFEEAVPFKTHRFLDDYTYSLLKIYKRYVRPGRHFGRVITELPSVDFDTLKEERIYVDRTLFGRLINSMPYQNRLQFLLFIIEEFNEADLRKIPFSQAFPLLKDFVGTGIVEMGKYLIKAEELINDNKAIFKNNTNVGFAYEADLKPIVSNKKREKKKEPFKIDIISEQVELFKNVFEIDNDFNELFSSNELNYKKADRELFDKTFNKRA